MSNRPIKLTLLIASLLALVLVTGLLISGTQPASAQQDPGPIDLNIYPTGQTGLYMPTTGSSFVSELISIALRGINGFSGPVILDVKNLPVNTTLTCSSHCVAAPNQDFPITLSVKENEWITITPTLISSAPAGAYTFQIEATPQGFPTETDTLELVRAPYAAGRAMVNPGGDPDLYKKTVTAGQSFQTTFLGVADSQFSGEAVFLSSFDLGEDATDMFDATITDSAGGVIARRVRMERKRGREQ